MTLKQKMEKIWRDNKCRSPLGPTHWTLEEDYPHTTRERNNLHYTAAIIEKDYD